MKDKEIDWRRYDAATDLEAIQRIWLEVGWLEPGNARHRDALGWFAQAGDALVGLVRDEPECLVLTAAGTLRYQRTDLPFSAVSGVTTSVVARKQGIASRLTARAVAEAAQAGAAVSGLGAFEQGYYTRFGFGMGGYDHKLIFDPGELQVPAKARPPYRLTVDDWEEMHAARLRRTRHHGSVSLTAPEVTRAEACFHRNGFGLGYRDGGNGALSHHIWLQTEHIDHGPYCVEWLCFETPAQFLELMALIQTLGEQVRVIKMMEPRGIQLQDFRVTPFRDNQVRHEGRFKTGMEAVAWWQMRINDAAACIAAIQLPGQGELRFNLTLSDPIEPFLPIDIDWRGAAGEYVVTLGASSGAERGRDAALPTLEASVNALTRMWLGVRPATGLAITDDMAGPPELLEALDETLCMPDPYPDWTY